MEKKKHLIFPGWIMVVLAMLCLTFTGNFMVQSTSTANAMMMADETTAVNRTLYGLAFTVAALCKGFPQPLVGALQDKKGSKFVFRIGALVAAFVGLIGCRMINGSGLMFIIMYGIGSGVIYMCASQIPTAGVVNAWFVKKRGSAQTIIQCGTVLAGVLCPKLVNYFVKSQGNPWYYGYYIFGVGAIITLILTFFIKEHPEEMGLTADGDMTAEEEAKLAQEKKPEVRVYVRDMTGQPPIDYKSALKTAAFWLISFAIVAGTYCNNVLQNPGDLVFYDYGYTSDFITTVKAARQLCRLVVIFGLFHLTPRIEPIRIMGVILAVNGLVLVWSGTPTSPLCVWMFYMVCTASITGYLVVGPVALTNYFGKKDAGKIIGFMLLLTGVIGSLSSTLSGLCYDIFGSYTYSFYLFAAICFAGAICSFCVRYPKKTRIQTESPKN